MKFSIIFGTHNRAKITRDCIREDMKRAGVDETEWIWVDDGSTDNVREKVKRLYPDISILRNFNQGIAKTFNQGYSIATGDWIFKLDSDIVLPENWLKRIKKYIEAIPETAAIGIPFQSTVENVPEEDSIDFAEWFGDYKVINGFRILEAKKIMGFYGFSRKLFNKVGYLNEGLPYYSATDTYWSNRAMKTGELIYYLPELRALHLGESKRLEGIEDLDPDRERKDKSEELTDQQREAIKKVYYNPYI